MHRGVGWEEDGEQGQTRCDIWAQWERAQKSGNACIRSHSVVWDKLQVPWLWVG